MNKILSLRFDLDIFEGFFDIGKELYDWRVTTPPVLNAGTDIVAWLEEFHSQIEGCDLIALPGGIGVLGNLSAEYLVDVIRHLTSKISYGCPFVCEMGGLYEILHSPFSDKDCVSQIQIFFRWLGVLPTTYEIFSQTDRLEQCGVVDDKLCWFRRADGCFINPDLFRSVDRLLISNATAINYDTELYPVALSSSTHQLVDRVTDLAPKFPLGQRPCIAAVLDDGGRFAIFLTGCLLISPNSLPMISEIEKEGQNTTFIKNLVILLSERQVAYVLRKTANDEIYRLENNLGRLILGAFKNDLPNNLESLQGVFFDGLKKIIQGNWHVFESYMEGINRGKFLKNLGDINRGLRRISAHPIISLYEEIPESQIPKIKMLNETVSRAVQKLAAG
jgi:hypothetical protein